MKTIRTVHGVQRDLVPLRHRQCRRANFVKASLLNEGALSSGLSSRDSALLADVLEQLKSMNSRLSKISKQVTMSIKLFFGT